LLAQGLMALRENAMMARVVNTDYSREAAEQGDTINVPIPSAVTAVDVSPAITPPANADQTPTKVAIALSNWKEAPFYLTDKQMHEVMNGWIPKQASEAIRSIINAMDSSMLALYKGMYGAYTATTANSPMASIKDATGMRKVLNQNLAPLDSRHAILDPAAEAEALGLNQFADSTFSGSVAAIMEGQLNRKLGAQWWMNQNVPTHTAGTQTGNSIIKASTAHAVGVKSLTCTTAASTGAVAYKEGDIITIAGDTQTYVVTADVTEASAATDYTTPIEPGLKVALTGSEVITLDDASGVVNMMIHRDAIALATRPLADVDMGLGAISMSDVDPVSGLALRVEVTRQHKQTRFSYDMLWGTGLVRNGSACRLLEQ
jgi:hypothetical protein